MINKVIGGILLIIGTSIGGGMLALPMATAAGGFYHSILLFVSVWAVTMLAGFYTLEVNLWLPPGSNLVSMARETLGRIGQVVTWLAYLLLLYTLLSAYMAGGSDLFFSLLKMAGIDSPHWLDAILFALVLGSILFFGVCAVDWANRGLMSVKLIAYFILLVLIAPNIDFSRLSQGHVYLLSSAVMVVMTAFGYTIIIPTLRSYFNSHVNALRLTIAVGSLIPLLCYLMWDFVIQGSLASQGGDGLAQMAVSGHAVSNLTNALAVRLHSHTISVTIHFFTSICIATSFLGVSLCLTDFLADGLGVKKQGKARWLVMKLTLLPPLVIVLFFPGIFILSLGYAGILCVVLLTLIPALMVWSGRYIKREATGYRVFGGKWLLSIEIIIAFGLLAFAMWQVS